MQIACIKFPLPALLVLSLLSACDSGGSTSGFPSLNDDEGVAIGTDPYPNLSLNDSLTGRVFETDESRYTDASLTILSLEGEEIARDSDKVGSYDWLPDNRLVFTLGKKIGMQVDRSSFTTRRSST